MISTLATNKNSLKNQTLLGRKILELWRERERKKEIYVLGSTNKYI
jgi:hypothetical protein